MISTDLGTFRAPSLPKAEETSKGNTAKMMAGEVTCHLETKSSHKSNQTSKHYLLYKARTKAKQSRDAGNEEHKIGPKCLKKTVKAALEKIIVRRVHFIDQKLRKIPEECQANWELD